MKKRRHLFTSESVSMGHPDKLCDQTSDAFLDALLRLDPNARCAVETAVKRGAIWMIGEVASREWADPEDVVRSVVDGLGLSDPAHCLFGASPTPICCIGRQSPNIAVGVDVGHGLHNAQGAGDQGLMFGYACDETPELMPLELMLAHRLMRVQDAVRRAGSDIAGLLADAKSQVTCVRAGGKPERVHTVVLSTQTTDAWHEGNIDDLRAAVIEHIIKQALGGLWNDDIIVHVNPTGVFHIGGPYGDAGVTGRKIIVDTYGGRGRHGGGAFSGKDGTKVDRSGAYMARRIAKTIVAAELAPVVEVQLGYAIGVAEPVSVSVDTQGTTDEATEQRIEEAVPEVFDLTPAGIIAALGLRRPIYGPTAFGGHFGREYDPATGAFSWENVSEGVPALQGAMS